MGDVRGLWPGTRGGWGGGGCKGIVAWNERRRGDVRGLWPGTRGGGDVRGLWPGRRGGGM